MIRPEPDGASATGPMFTTQELDLAAELVHSHMAATPSIHWPLLSHDLGVDTVVKHENCTPTGAFKVRGGLVYLDRLKKQRPDVGGVISATVGNHGLSLAWAGRLAGVEVVIVVPQGTDKERVASLEMLGAEVVIQGSDFEDSRQHAASLAEVRSLEMVPAFHPDLVLGVATYAQELFNQAGPLDAVYVPIGMGSGICGLITTRNLLGLDTEIIGVSATGAPAQKLSFDAGEVVGTDRVDTFAAGVATRQPDPTSASIIRSGAYDVITVDDKDTAAAVRQLWRTTHHLAEPAGAIATAAAAKHSRPDSWQRIGVIMSGSNIDTDTAAAVLAGHL